MTPPSVPPTGPLPAGIVEQRVSAGGIDFRCLSTQPLAGGKPAGGTPVLLLHGFGARAELWVPLLSKLSSSRLVIAPDLPCHGGSTSLPGKKRPIGEYRRALAAFLDQLGYPQVDVVGSSLGGALGAMLAVDRPLKVRRLVLLAASGLTPKLPSKTVNLYFPYVLRSYLVAPGPSTFRSFLGKGVFHDPKWIDEAWIRYLVAEWRPRPRRSSYLATANAMRRPDASVASELGKIGCPTLLLWGKQDAHFDWQENQAAAKAIAGSRFVPYEACGHLPMVEQFRAASNEVVQFLGA